jgi:cbb3-type cytochrome oxidase maturation protein
MSVVYIALPAALLLALLGVIAFIWAVRSGQMDDLETPGLRMLTDDDTPKPPSETADD